MTPIKTLKTTIETLKNNLLQMQNDAIDIINNHINRINNIIEENTVKQYKELKLKTPISYKNIDSNHFENILYIGISNRNYVVIERNDTSEYIIPIKAVKIDTLFSIVEQLQLIQSFNDVANYLI